jgi:hypothetical protein
VLKKRIAEEMLIRKDYTLKSNADKRGVFHCPIPLSLVVCGTAQGIFPIAGNNFPGVWR